MRLFYAFTPAFPRISRINDFVNCFFLINVAGNITDMLSVNVFDGMDVNHFFVSILVSHNILRVTVIHFRFLPIHLTSRILLNAGKEGFASDKYTVASPQFFICNFVFLVFLNPPQIGTVNPFERGNL